LNIIIPTLGGHKGFKVPRYLIKINNEYIIESLIKKLKFNANFIFVISHRDKIKFKSDKILKSIKPKCKIIITKKKTKGILKTILLAENLINNEKLIISNCDHFLNLDKEKFLRIIKEKKNFGCIFTYSPSTKDHCFLNYTGKYVKYAAERKKVSNIAAAGVYYFQNGKNFIKYIHQVIKKKKTFNKIYYISSVFNEMIDDNKKILHAKLKNMFPLGSPSELKIFIKKKKLNYSDFLHTL
jgi:dTDP-glucose pyrophosphorylase